MKQKIGIVQALMTRPPVVILDEPTAGLDPFMVHAFREVIDDLRRTGETTVFLSSHVLTEVEATCDRVGIIRGGRIVNVTALDELKAHASTPGGDRFCCCRPTTFEDPARQRPCGHSRRGGSSTSMVHSSR